MAELQWSAAPARSTNVGDTVSVCAASVLLAVIVYLPSLTVEQKPSKGDRNKKLNTSFTNRKWNSELKTWKHSAKNGRVGRHFLLYAAVS